jgi:hypothetical protein
VFGIQNGNNATADLGDLLDNTYEKLSGKNAANGYAGLDANSKINPSQLPAIAVTDTFVVNTQAAMLALDAQTGDVAVRTDINKSFILQGADPSILGNWQELISPTDAVASVFGRTGVVTAQSGDYNSDQISETASRVFVSPAQKTVIQNTSGTNTGDESQSSIKTKLGQAGSAADGYLGSADWNTFNSKQAALGFTPENSSNKENTTIDTSTTKYPTVNLLKTGLDTKQNLKISRVSITGASSLSSTHEGKLIEFSSASNFTFTLTQQSDGFQGVMVNLNTGDVTLAAGSGVTIMHETANRKIATQYRFISYYYRSATEVVIAGTLEA